MFQRWYSLVQIIYSSQVRASWARKAQAAALPTVCWSWFPWTKDPASALQYQPVCTLTGVLGPAWAVRGWCFCTQATTSVAMICRMTISFGTDVPSWRTRRAGCRLSFRKWDSRVPRSRLAMSAPYAEWFRVRSTRACRPTSRREFANWIHTCSARSQSVYTSRRSRSSGSPVSNRARVFHSSGGIRARARPERYRI